MVAWNHLGKDITSHDDFTDDAVGFVYRITYEDGREYIGSKLIRSLVKLKPTLEQLAKRKNYVRKEMKNKPFVNYIGSSKNTIGLKIASREILEICSSKRALTYMEAYYLFSLKVLEGEKYLNDNILGKFYRNVLD